MKVTHVLPALTKGGGERVAADLASQAVCAGHEVTIVTGWPVNSAYMRDALHPDVRVMCVSDATVSKVGKFIDILPWLWRHRSWLAEQDILHCHLTYGEVFGSAVRLLGPTLGLQRPAIVATYHSVGMPIPALHRWGHAMMAAHFDAFALMAEDDYWRTFIERRPTLPSAFIPNGISIQTLGKVSQAERRAYRREIGIPDECRYVVGTIGRLHPDRKPWLYIPIFAEIVGAFGPEVHFVLAGDGSEYDHMRSLVAEYRLEKQVHLPGLILEPRLPLSIMDLYFAQNVGSVTGIAGLEAASLDVPVLAIQLLPNYKTKPEDWIWSGTNLSEIAKRAVALLRNPADLRAVAERQAVCVRLHYTAEAMARSYDSLYSSAVDRNHARAR